MKITIDWGNSGTCKLTTNDTEISKVVEDYPELSMMSVMEELSELSMAISKGLRNGSSKKLDNIAEEIVDVLLGISFIVKKFNITPQQIEKCFIAKGSRLSERVKTDTAIFRSERARKDYRTSKGVPGPVKVPGMIIRKLEEGKYSLDGDTNDIPEYYHVLSTAYEEWLNKNKPKPESKPKKKTKSKTGDNPFKQYDALIRGKKTKKKGKDK